MKTELMYLAWVSALTGVIWVPYILDRIMVWGLTDAVGYPASPKPQSAWAQRMMKAHANAVENLVVFAALVLAAHALGVSTGASSSIPRSDHVPELKNAVLSRAVMAATADAVSCDAEAITGVPANESNDDTPGNNGPITEPGSTSSAGSLDGSPSRSIRFAAHCLVTAFTICVVLAIVNSHRARPVSQ